MSPEDPLQLRTNRGICLCLIVYLLECDFFPDRWSSKIRGRYSSCFYSGHGDSMYIRRFVDTSTLLHYAILQKPQYTCAPQPSFLISRTFSIIFHDSIFLKSKCSSQHLILPGVSLIHIRKIWSQLKWNRYKIQNAMSACSVMYVGVKQKNGITRI